MTRRSFLALGGGLAAGFGGLPAWLARAASAAAATKRTLAVLFLRGAADGLNILAPWKDPLYKRLRPSIALAAPGADGGCLDLDGRFGLHPSLAPLLPLYRSRDLAFVHAAGSPDPTRSHFDAQDYMECGVTGRAAADGWMNRALAAAPSWRTGPLAAVAVAARLPRSLRGAAPAMAFSDADQVRQGGLKVGGFEAMYDEAVDALLAGAAHDLREASGLLSRLPGKGKGDQEAAGYPKGPLGRDLFELARLLKADVGVRLAFVEAGGWDHHADEGAHAGRLAQRLGELGPGLAAFRADLGEKAGETLLLVMTEFGRAVQENGNRGTDHGHGSVMMLMGPGLRGGRVHGRWPGLEREALFEGRDLAVTTDYRQVLSEALRGPMGLSAAAGVFPGFKPGPATGVFS
ncbi:MAG: DUF1501 domain-containing protein [Elusimicrobia bacterium]|nr:DUF1501 domain-containing protein [Elusimicrobiota bacterium]